MRRSVTLVSCGLLLAALHATPALAQAPAGNPPANGEWATAFSSREQLEMLATTRRFDEVEKALRALSIPDQQYPDGSSKAAIVYAFIVNEVLQHKSWATEARVPSRFTTWQAAFPTSDFVAIAQALQLPQPAGEKRLEQVSPELRQSAVMALARNAIRDGRPLSVSTARSASTPDMRPAKCFLPGAEHMPMCAVSQWPSFGLTEQRLEGFAQSRDWLKLERGLADLSASGALFANGSSHATAVLNLIGRYAGDGEGAPESLPPLKEWRTAHPDSAFVMLIDVKKLHREAWAVRGGGYASSVSPESWEIFRAKLRQAESRLEAAPPSIRETPVWYALMLDLAQDNRGKRDAAQVFAEAATRWPRHMDFYTRLSSRLLPKWGGSWELLESFIDQSARSLQASEGQATYARLYVERDADITGQKTRVNWPRMKQGFEDWIVRYDDDLPRNLYASQACRARDKEGFVKAMRLLPQDKVVGMYWLKGYAYKACAQWAGV